MSDDDTPAADELPAEPSPADPPLGDAAHPARRKRIINRIEREAEEARMFWAGVFDSPVGRREIWRLLQAGHPFETRLAVTPAGLPDPKATDYYRGEQDFALRMYHGFMARCPAQVILMHQEHDARFGAPPVAPRAKLPS